MHLSLFGWVDFIPSLLHLKLLSLNAIKRVAKLSDVAAQELCGAVVLAWVVVCVVYCCFLSERKNSSTRVLLFMAKAHAMWLPRWLPQCVVACTSHERVVSAVAELFPAL